MKLKIVMTFDVDIPEEHLLSFYDVDTVVEATQWQNTWLLNAVSKLDDLPADIAVTVVTSQQVES